MIFAFVILIKPSFQAGNSIWYLVLGSVFCPTASKLPPKFSIQFLKHSNALPESTTCLITNSAS